MRDLTVTGVQTCALPICFFLHHHRQFHFPIHFGRVFRNHKKIIRPHQRRCRLEKNRSEEHTSELQSQSNLVCRLLLEKKNTSVSRPCPPAPTAPLLSLMS